MKKLICGIIAVGLLVATPALADWWLVWDANVEPNIVGYNVYFNNTVIGTANATEYNVGKQVPTGCWSVSAVNDTEMEGALSDPLCRDVPGKANGLRLEKRN